jgi:uncharacterized damage-inducible protein DinB
LRLGQLAFHIASIPSNNLSFAKNGEVETLVIVNHPIPMSKKEILNALEESIQYARNLLTQNDDWLKNDWNLLKDNFSVAKMSAISFIRTFVLNHWCHHRRELAAYLRVLDIELPSIFGPTADVNLFA